MDTPVFRLGPIALTPPVLLAPMAGITDLPYRRLVASFGGGLVGIPYWRMGMSGNNSLFAAETARTAGKVPLGLW